ncbi:DUF2905 domain-containing protein [Hymenobacter rubripertinctus]|uniref:DUF2905 domain-containing protein n=1 Tax=Hymenobacter rubripertinctus TaxID=2029981 RepID=A0A418QQH2_9BACT|nr:DUF2905 domain-containing protein [Hymenobacter rubripertinctus]RIY07497.1 DUF2905 domain-containing protein [Hymenobacter rubripertinctus]
MPPHLGKTLFLVGLGLMLLGALLWLGGGNLLGWFGRLPGDIRVERPGFRFYAPIVSMVVVSLVLSALLWLGRKLGG